MRHSYCHRFRSRQTPSCLASWMPHSAITVSTQPYHTREGQLCSPFSISLIRPHQTVCCCCATSPFILGLLPCASQFSLGLLLHAVSILSRLAATCISIPLPHLHSFTYHLALTLKFSPCA